MLQVEPVQTVGTSYGVETNVRNGVCGDLTSCMPFALWRDLATTPLSCGDCIHLTNAIISKTTDGQAKLSGNQRTTIEVCFVFGLFKGGIRQFAYIKYKYHCFTIFSSIQAKTCYLVGSLCGIEH